MDIALIDFSFFTYVKYKSHDDITHSEINIKISKRDTPLVFPVDTSVHTIKKVISYLRKTHPSLLTVYVLQGDEKLEVTTNLIELGRANDQFIYVDEYIDFNDTSVYFSTLDMPNFEYPTFLNILKEIKDPDNQNGSLELYLSGIKESVLETLKINYLLLKKIPAEPIKIEAPKITTTIETNILSTVLNIEEIFNNFVPNDDIPFASIIKDSIPVFKVHKNIKDRNLFIVQGADRKKVIPKKEEELDSDIEEDPDAVLKKGEKRKLTLAEVADLRTKEVEGNFYSLKSPQGLTLKVNMESSANKYATVNIYQTKINIVVSFSVNQEYTEDTFDQVKEILFTHIGEYITGDSIDSYHRTFDINIPSQFKFKLSDDIFHSKRVTYSEKDGMKYSIPDSEKTITFGLSESSAKIYKTSFVGYAFVIMAIIKAFNVSTELAKETANIVKQKNMMKPVKKLAEWGKINEPDFWIGKDLWSTKCQGKTKQPVMSETIRPLEGSYDMMYPNRPTLTGNKVRLVCTDENYRYPGLLNDGRPCCFKTNQLNKIPPQEKQNDYIITKNKILKESQKGELPPRLLEFVNRHFQNPLRIGIPRKDLKTTYEEALAFQTTSFKNITDGKYPINVFIWNIAKDDFVCESIYTYKALNLDYQNVIILDVNGSYEPVVSYEKNGIKKKFKLDKKSPFVEAYYRKCKPVPLIDSVKFQEYPDFAELFKTLNDKDEIVGLDNNRFVTKNYGVIPYRPQDATFLESLDLPTILDTSEYVLHLTEQIKKLKELGIVSMMVVRNLKGQLIYIVTGWGGFVPIKEVSNPTNSREIFNYYPDWEKSPKIVKSIKEYLTSGMNALQNTENYNDFRYHLKRTLREPHTKKILAIVENDSMNYKDKVLSVVKIIQKYTEKKSFADAISREIVIGNGNIIKDDLKMPEKLIFGDTIILDNIDKVLKYLDII